MAVTKRGRYEVLRRDGFRCRYCGATPQEAELTIDHVQPISLGGSDAANNLVTSCRDCNTGKASTSPDAQVVQDVDKETARWIGAMKQAADVLRGRRERVADYCDMFEDVWGFWKPANWESSLEALYEAGLPFDEMVDSARIATQARLVESRFRYFCGVAWRKVGDMQEVAKSLLEAEDVETRVADGA